MIVVHHLNNSRSQRILWLLEELGLDYEVKRYERDSNTMLAPAALKEVHPLGKSPVITDEGQTLAESGAITDYLVERYGEGKLAPPLGTPEKLRYDYWLHYSEGSAMPLLVMKLLLDNFGLGDSSVAGQFVTPQIKLHFDYLESELSKNEWFVGEEFTAADIQMSFPVEAVEAQAGLDASRPKLKAFLERIHTRPAYQRALERGGKYELLT
ncbi:glutathione S-transferase family protein [Chlorogloea sp. CCALA 695]|uniref:glutathione S-transferase family protein n=1 Tax=Chlorogloea sp. CCALA 695 TaxID=2107693 RepID=UPI000D07E154|nr:glutathione S-transferase [Chlorogloea sp. CCALA 695]PSB31541.1 glutathione S-transferase [Chlorogloea sp. CCALA 695]